MISPSLQPWMSSSLNGWTFYRYVCQNCNHLYTKSRDTFLRRSMSKGYCLRLTWTCLHLADKFTQTPSVASVTNISCSCSIKEGNTYTIKGNTYMSLDRRAAAMFGYIFIQVHILGFGSVLCDFIHPILA